MTSSTRKAPARDNLAASARNPVDCKADWAAHDDPEVQAQLKGNKMGSALKIEIMQAYVQNYAEICGYIRRDKGPGDRWTKAASWMVKQESIGANWTEYNKPVQIPRVAVALKNDVSLGKKMAREVVTSGKAAKDVAPSRGCIWWQDSAVHNFFTTSMRVELQKRRESPLPSPTVAAPPVSLTGYPEAASSLSSSIMQQALQQAAVIPIDVTTTDAAVSDSPHVQDDQAAAMAAAGSKRKRQPKAAQSAIGTSASSAAGHAEVPPLRASAAMLAHASQTRAFEIDKFEKFDSQMEECVLWVLEHLPTKAASMLSRALLNVPRGAVHSDAAHYHKCYNLGVACFRIIPILLKKYGDDTAQIVRNLRMVLHCEAAVVQSLSDPDTVSSQIDTQTWNSGSDTE